jgi:ABC-type transporter Mla MlaB component
MDSRTMTSTGLRGTEAVAGPAGERTRTQVIRVAGDLRDTVFLKRLNDAATRCVRPGRGRLVLDLEAVEEADTRLVAELVTIAQRAVKAGVAWQVRASEKLRRWITLYKLDRVLMSGGTMVSPAAGGAGTDGR